jgi:histidine triad (HIT) family protein
MPVLSDRGRRTPGRGHLSGRSRNGDRRHPSHQGRAYPDRFSRQHVPYFEDLPEATASRIIHVGQRLSRAMKSLYGVERVGFALTGGDHAHVHAHVVPMHDKTDITSRRYIAEEKITFRSTPRASDEELASRATALRTALERA